MEFEGSHQATLFEVEWVVPASVVQDRRKGKRIVVLHLGPDYDWTPGRLQGPA